jgi:hypothetical protein
MKKLTKGFVSLLIAGLLSGCTSITSQENILDDLAAVVQPPKSEDYFVWEVIDYSKDEDGSFISVGNLTLKIRITNVSNETVNGIANTLEIKDSTGKEILKRNFNSEKSLAPGESMNLGYFGKKKLPLIASVEFMKPIIETENLLEETELNFEIRKVLRQDGSILEFNK